MPKSNGAADALRCTGPTRRRLQWRGKFPKNRQKTGNFAHFGTVLRIMETHLYKMLRRRSLDKNTPNSLKWITGKKQAKAGKEQRKKFSWWELFGNSEQFKKIKIFAQPLKKFAQSPQKVHILCGVCYVYLST